MLLRRKRLLTDRETIAGLVTVLTPIARRLATDRELREELRSAADSLAGAYRRTRGDHERRRTARDGRVYAFEEPSHGSQAAGSRVAAEIVGNEDAPPTRRRKSGLLRVGLAAGAAAGAALLASRHARGGGSRRA